MPEPDAGAGCRTGADAGYVYLRSAPEVAAGRPGPTGLWPGLWPMSPDVPATGPATGRWEPGVGRTAARYGIGHGAARPGPVAAASSHRATPAGARPGS
jgi:hypothetical protein